MYSAFPGNCSVPYLSFVYGRSLWEELNGGENSLHWQANMLPLFSIMTITIIIIFYLVLGLCGQKTHGRKGGLSPGVRVSPVLCGHHFEGVGGVHQGVVFGVNLPPLHRPDFLSDTCSKTSTSDITKTREKTLSASVKEQL